MSAMESRWVLAVAVVATTLLITGCRSQVAARDAGVQETAQIVVSDAPAEFEPRDVTIKAGGSVRWVNTGGIAHSVEFIDNTDARKPLSGVVLEPKGDYTRVFATPGTYRYLCRFHIITGMVGKVVVEGSPNVASAAPAPAH